MWNCRRALLPEWRYWPAIPLATIITLSIAAFAFAPPLQKTGIHSTQKQKSQDKLKDSEERLADYTLWLTWLTGGIVFTGFLQILVLMRTDKSTTLAARASMKQTVIARRQLLISGQQAAILTRQSEIQRQEFLITHRPRIRIRGINGPIKLDGKTIEVIANYSNVGATKAQIMQTKLEVFCIGKDGELIPVIADGFSKDEKTLDSGFASTIRRTIPADAPAIFPPPVRRLMVSGAVLYRDGAKIVRVTSFGRTNNPPSIRLDDMTGLEDLNFED